MIDSIAQSGLAGIQRGFESAARNAQEVVNAYTRGEDTIAPSVGLITDRTQIQASARVIKVADELNGAILDILA